MAAKFSRCVKASELDCSNSEADLTTLIVEAVSVEAAKWVNANSLNFGLRVFPEKRFFASEDW